MVVLEFVYWPPHELSPNARCHWSRKAKHVQAARAYARMATPPTKITQQGKIKTYVWFHPPDKRDRDLDNLLASVKGLIDGVCDKLGINDRLLRPITTDILEPVKGGKVVIELEVEGVKK